MMLGFKQRFEQKILAKEKRHTIRAKRRGLRQWKVGDRADCYVNPRQKSTRLMGRWRVVRVQDIWIKRIPCGDMPDAPAYWRYSVFIDGERLKPSECKQLAIADGFETFDEMMAFWRGRLPFHGDMIHWNPDEPVAMRRKRRVQRP